ncbi:hypothetical protein ASZ90_009121 [hydrocarbon metagenome]|uniref:Uncharacterized protein n=1 Tax=hydrocarbon metagenome TaxID=938273 RepID=A0A0W8FJP7_9ZZZZ
MIGISAQNATILVNRPAACRLPHLPQAAMPPAGIFPPAGLSYCYVSLRRICTGSSLAGTQT